MREKNEGREELTAEGGLLETINNNRWDKDESSTTNNDHGIFSQQ